VQEYAVPLLTELTRETTSQCHSVKEHFGQVSNVL